MNFTMDMKYNVQQIGSEFSRHLLPLSVLTSQVEHEIDLFYVWSSKEMEELKITMNEKFFDGMSKDDRLYVEEIAGDSLEWYQNEGKEMFLLFKKSLEPLIIEKSQLKDLRESAVRLKTRWNDLKSDIESIEEFENLFNWLLDLPYLFKKRLESFGMVLSSSDVHSSLILRVEKKYELKKPIIEASPLEACLSFTFKERCANYIVQYI